jgi:tetratricopeptide (TPR) repeat protein
MQSKAYPPISISRKRRRSLPAGVAVIFALTFTFSTTIGCINGQNMLPDMQYSGNAQQPTGTQPLTQAQARAMNLANDALAPIQQGNWELAMSYLQQALDLDPNCLGALLNAGMCCTQLNRFDEGINYSSRVIQMAPERFEAWVNLGSCYQGAGRLAEALQTYQEYLKRFPNEAHRTQIESLAKQLALEVARQNAVAAAAGRSNIPGIAGGADDANDYFAYSIPDSIVKWRPESMPIKVFVPTDAQAQNIPGYMPVFGQSLLAAFKEWADRSNGKISYQLVPRPDVSDIECRWVGDPSQVRTPAEGGDADILAEVGHGLKHVKISILTHPDRSVNQTTAANTVFTTALHEVGHALGITGHSPDPNDIMFSSVRESVNPRHLTARDVNTLLHLYRSDVQTAGEFQATTGNPKLDLSNQATTLMQQNDFAGATKMLEAALKLDPNFQVAKINLAVCLTNSANQMGQSGKYHEAISHYKRALELLREDRDNRRKGTIMKNYAAMLFNTQHTKEAQEMDAAATRLLQGGQ